MEPPASSMATTNKVKFLGEVSTALYEGDDNREQCKQEIMTFLKGGVGGAQRLKEVLSSLFSYYKLVTTEGKIRLLLDCQLHPYISDTNDDVTFIFRGCDVPDQFRPSRNMKGANAWISLIQSPNLAQDPSRHNLDQDPSTPVEGEV